MNKNASLILETINASTDHLTAEQLFLRLKEQGASLSLATVYNNLTSLYDKGFIRKVRTDNGPDRYDKIKRHDHLVCKKCGKLSDVTLEDFTERIQHDIGMKILSYDLNISYLCEDCVKSERASAVDEPVASPMKRGKA